MPHWDKKLDQWVFLLNKYKQTNVINSESETNVCYCAFMFQRDHLKIAQQFFQLVGGSASECGTFNRNLINMILESTKAHFVSMCV